MRHKLATGRFSDPGSRGKVMQRCAYKDLSGVVLAVAFATVAHAETVKISFDEIDTSVTSVTGKPVENYLRGFGVELVKQTSIPGTATLVIDAARSPAGFEPVSYPNIFSQMGAQGPISFTLRFARALASLSFWRAVLNPGPNGITHPKWHAEVSGASGAIVAAVDEALIVSRERVPAKQFKLAAPAGDAILEVTISADNRLNARPFAAYSGAIMDDFVLEYAQ
jgi:hypothetical protein